MRNQIIQKSLVGVISDSTFKPVNYIQQCYSEVASEMNFRDEFTKDVIDLFKDWILITEEYKSNKGEIDTKSKVFIKQQVGNDVTDGCIIAEVSGNWHFNYSDSKDEFEEVEEDSADVTLYFTQSCRDKAMELTNEINKYIIVEESEDMSQIYLVTQTRNGFDLEEFDIKNPKMDLELNYGKHFVDVSEKVVCELSKKKNKGLVLLHGEPGTGKTTYIKWLVSQLGEKKKVIFVPPFLTESITSPEFIPFLARHTNSVLVIEDAERVVGDRVSGTSSSIGVSNILNMTDGIMGDVMSIQIICSFNMSRSKIDPALLRKGRLIAEHKFDLLDVEATNVLLKHLGHDKTVNKGMSLADIYNIDEEVFTVSENKKVGF